MELPELLPEGDEDSVEYAPSTNAYGLVTPSHMGWDWRIEKPTRRNPFSHPTPPMGIRTEREFVDKLDMENFDLKTVARMHRTRARQPKSHIVG
ncbi:hypothetical protein SeLEV6574_g06737 [Synchytrium endobioticum]|uniref:Uncharacterized protein n=1 Tax=Synchytrium endobioticum TaxID=286115 RepID=A0A507CGE4_9FUNG|nr:hypothetical protein SeLEV6574_g06737 [Synchytrium endobioticum]